MPQPADPYSPRIGRYLRRSPNEPGPLPLALAPVRPRPGTVTLWSPAVNRHPAVGREQVSVPRTCFPFDYDLLTYRSTKLGVPQVAHEVVVGDLTVQYAALPGIEATFDAASAVAPNPILQPTALNGGITSLVVSPNVNINTLLIDGVVFAMLVEALWLKKGSSFVSYVTTLQNLGVRVLLREEVLDAAVDISNGALVDQAGSFGSAAIAASGTGVLGRARVGTPVATYFDMLKLQAYLTPPELVERPARLDFTW